MKHTPAPWKLSADKKHIIAPMDSPIYFAVAEILNWETDYETTQSNARLIAAAPELLDALKNLEAAASTLDDQYPLIAEMCADARALIAHLSQ